MIIRLHHAQIPIPPDAEDRAREFYCRVLGLTEIEKPTAIAKNGGFWLELGDMQIHIGADPTPMPPKSKAHVAYEVTDLAAWRARLETHGYTSTDGIPIPGFIRADTRDPFGNRVEFLQRVDDQGEA